MRHLLSRAGYVAAALSAFLLPFGASAAPPNATTSAASTIATTSARLNGSGQPNAEQTTGWFRISTVDPGTCDDSFGTRVPATSGTDLGSGTVSVPYSITTTGLSPGTVYYFCAIVSNASGVALGGVLSFMTPDVPVVTTTPPTNITNTTATLEGLANPEAATTTGWFRYATTNPGTCNDTFGTRAPTTGGTALGAGAAPVAYTRAVSGLSPGTTYYVCAIAQNAIGTSVGAVLSFTTLPSVPVVTTNSATLLTGASAQLNGTANPGGGATTGWFRYATTSPGTCNDTFGTRAPAAGGSALGSGLTSAAYAQGLTGLSPQTQYYYCAIAQNSAGTTFGAVVTFTTPAAPQVVTVSSTLITNTTAQLNGTGDPNGASASGYFRYALTDPGTCNDTFGSRAPTSGGSALGSGTSAVSYAQSIAGLSPGTTYYYCAIGSNIEGLGFGAVLTFTTAAPPSMTTGAVTSLASTSATLNGSGIPNSSATTATFRYSTTNPGTCTNTFGTVTTATNLGSGVVSVAFTRPIAGLTPGTTYYYCAIGTNTYGTTFGAVLSFVTPAAVPVVSTNSATLLTGNSAQLNGTVNPSGDATTGWFRYATASPGTCNDTFGTRAPAAGGSAVGSGVTSVAFSQPIAGLAPATLYYYCAIAQNSVGTTFGTVLSFTTPSGPVMVTVSSTLITNTTAQLNGTGDPNGATTNGYFRYSSTDPGTCNDTFGSRAPTTGGSALGSGTTAVSYAQSIAGLSPGTTYYYCALGTNIEGLGFGAVLTFTTAAPPTMTTAAATSLASTSATLNGSGIPNSSATTATFRYSTTNPGTCTNTFGTVTTATNLGSGVVSVAYTRPIAGLTPGTTYYYCAIGTNTYGTSFGAVQSFTTPSALPVVSTNSATLLTGNSAQLNGTVNPSGDATTAWFRYATASPGTCNDTFGTRAPAAGGSAVGSGVTSVAFSQPIAGLAPATLYYYCAIAQNSVGTTFGTVLSFTTPSGPVMVTVSSTLITNTTAQLNGNGDPNGASTNGYFRYSSTDPGVCNDTFGSRAPTTGGSALGSGTAAVSYAQSISGLSPGTTYYYCALGTNIEGLGFGAVLSFTTAAPPTMTTAAATSLASTSATLNGSGIPNSSATTATFRYSTTNPGTCTNTFGTVTTATNLGSGVVSVAYTRPIAGLTPGTTYYYCAIGTNTYGTSFGAVQSFTTPSALPVVSTNSATLLTGNSAQLNGTVNPSGDATTAWFRYATASPGTCNDTFGTRAPAAGGSAVGSGVTSVAFSQPIAGLAPATLYYYCAIAQNSVGTTFGTVLSFTTPSGPVMVTVSSTLITNTTAQLNGTGDPNGASTNGYFRYSATDPGTCNDTFGSRAPTTGGSALGSGTAAVSYAQSIAGLSPGTTYYYCAIGSNIEGLGFGAVLSFTTAAPPSMTTGAVTSLASTSGTLNGSGIPNSSATTATFRYSTTNPGTCTNTFGSVTTATNLGSGVVSVAYTRPIAGLTPGTTYYYCAIGTNTYGTSFGAVQSFSTPAAVPVVSTNSATLLTSASAQLNGSVNPSGDATTGWFRYSTASPGTCNDTFGTRAPAAGGSAVGSGVTSVGFSQPIAGLAPATLYFYCAIAQNSVGTTFGTVLSFTTPSGPDMVTVSSTLITNTTAQLNGTGDPNGASTNGYFRYALTDPGICSDTFGSRAPTTGGSALGAGTSAVSYAQSIAGLSPATTYYYCAIGSNSEGLGFGLVRSFTTAAPPTMTTAAVTSLASTSATLNGSGIPNSSATTATFRYSTTNPGTCTNTFGTVTTATNLGAGVVAVAYTRAIAGLTPGTTYYYCAIGTNTYGTSFGSVLSFTTPASAPAVSTVSASAVTPNTATLNGSANPNGDATTGWFRYATASPGTCNDTFGTRAPAAGGSPVGSGVTSVAFSQAISGLVPLTTYYYCAIGQNSVGTSVGAVLSFTTPSLPTVATLAATPVTAMSATLNASVNAHGFSTTASFRYSTVDPGICTTTFGAATPSAAVGSGTTPVNTSQVLLLLAPATTYYFCVIAQSAVGTSFGDVLSFTTPIGAPAVTTVAASNITSSAATLNAAVNPSGALTTVWFRYATTSPGTCDDTFGTRNPAAGGSAVGSGNTSVAASQAVSGLPNGTRVYYCAIAQNSIGTSFGAVLSFVTSAPSVTTLAASALSGTGATLNASGNPNGASTTGWFRYSATNPGTCSDTFGTRAPTTGGAALGSGLADVPFSRAITGLVAGTTYYYCAIAQNATGITFGAVLSLSTVTAPTVATLAATSVLSTSATLNGSANPNSDAATGWFRYSTTNPGACNDTFGTRAPTSGGNALGAGATGVAYSEAITGLVSGTTYYYCAIAANGAGTQLGSVASFTTTALPSVSTVAATSVTLTGATLNGAANPNAAATTGWFRYSATNPGTCNDTFGTRAPVAGGDALGAGTGAVSYAQAVTGLLSGTTYYFCAIASNAAGTSVGAVLSFTTPAAPTAVTLAATSVGSASAVMNGAANPNLVSTLGWFRFDTTNPGTCSDTFGTRVPSAGGTALGSGGAAVAYSQSLTGLSAGVTYYYCALASSAAGTSAGVVLSFTTTAPPSVSTSPATLVTATGATLNGAANPSSLASTGWFRYSTTNPGLCDDTFGTRAPGSGGTALGAGASPVAYASAVSGLAAGTTYYFCAIASNAAGTSVGAVQAFTTIAAPSVTSLAATSVGSTSATLNGSANPNLGAATGWFRYSATNPGACNDTFGTRAPTTGGTALGSGGSAVAYSESIGGLSLGTTYYYCAIASSSAGTRFGAVLSFTTTAAPVVTTLASSSVSSTGATLNATANPSSQAATGWFRYGASNPGVCSDTFGTRTPASGGTALGAGTTAVPYAEAITGLSAGTTYYFCAVADSAAGTSFGAVLSFTTPAAPTVATNPATQVTGAGATLNGAASPNTLATTGWFRYSTSNPGSCNDTFGTRAPTSGGVALGSGGASVAYSQVVSGLTPGTVYYYCAIAQNSVGTSVGSVLTFTTGRLPTVTTSAATLLTATGATLNGSANPNSDVTTGWFRYAATDPGACNDTFGTRAPTANGTSLGAGAVAQAYSAALTGLSPATTYYYCAIAASSGGTAFGAVLTFTTPAAATAPTVTTVAATAVGSTSATLQGVANPSLDAATGWFRYDTTNPGACNDTFGTRAPGSGGTALGAGSSDVPFSQVVSGLTTGRTYYYCAIASNAVGVRFGAVLSITTTSVPVVVTTTVSGVSGTRVTLEGAASPNGLESIGWFRYDTTDPGTCGDTFGTRVPTSGGLALGAGTTPVPYQLDVISLVPGTTYYFCALASSSAGLGVGVVLSWTAPAPPVVTTQPAIDLTRDSATLRASVSPSGAATTGWFRYDTTDPGTCDDMFGTRAPMTAVRLGAGNSLVVLSEAITGLRPMQAYYYCAIAENAEGTSFGAVASFTTPALIEPPVVSTDAPTQVTDVAAVLNGSADPRGDTTLGWFRYDSTRPAACDDSFGTRAPAMGGAALGQGTGSVAFSEPLTGLNTGTTYYACAIAANSAGVRFGEVVSFTPGARAPSVATDLARDVTGEGATLTGIVNANGSDTTGYFRLGTEEPSNCDDRFGTRVPGIGGVALGSGTASAPYEQAVADLEPLTTYYYCAAARNAGGGAFGAVVSFTTGKAPPRVTTSPADVLESGAVIFQGAADPRGSETTGWFRFASSDPGACDDTFGTRAPAMDGKALGAGRGDVAFSQAAPSLRPGTYFVCAIATSDGGVAFGDVVTFEVTTTTTNPPPDPLLREGGCSCDTTRPAEGMFWLVGVALLAWRRRRPLAAS
jgi:MYXO-CTERM domain-containing protein